jgi:hypothetical protein
MTTLAEAKIATDKVFADGIKFTQNDEDYENAARAIGLTKQLSTNLNYDKAKKVGLMQITIRQGIEMMLGEKIDKVFQLKPANYTHTHFYGKTAKIREESWNRSLTPEVISFSTVSGKLHKYQVGCPDYLKSKIPYGVLLRIKELGDLGLFDKFFAIAPLSLFRAGEAIEKDPVLTASVWIDDENVYKHFFVAQWSN